VLREPLTVAGIARAMGMTRQGVQRTADLLVDQGLAEYLPNPAHRRAKLLRPTEDGYAAVRRIDPGHAVMARRLASALGTSELSRTLDALTTLADTLDKLSPDA
jgi:DNA-binding MarR family transcriptional regulator